MIRRAITQAPASRPGSKPIGSRSFRVEKIMEMHGTTILAVRRGKNVVLAADGQVTLGNTVLKHSATKLRKLYDSNIIAGFAGATADAFTLFERFEAKLKDFSGNLQRSVVELAKEWRTDRVLRRLEAMLLVADAEHTYIITGNGDVLEPEHGAAAIGSGGNFALAAARAMVDQTDLPPKRIAEEAMAIAADLCIYTNDQTIYAELEG